MKRENKRMRVSRGRDTTEISPPKINMVSELGFTRGGGGGCGAVLLHGGLR